MKGTHSTSTNAQSLSQNYWRDGYASPVTVMSQEDAASLRQQIEKFESDYGQQGKDVLYTDPHFCVPFLYDLSLNDNILDAVEAVIGPDILCWSTGFFTKDAHDPHSFHGTRIFATGDWKAAKKSQPGSRSARQHQTAAVFVSYQDPIDGVW